MTRPHPQIAVQGLDCLVPQRKKAPATALPINPEEAPVEVNVACVLIMLVPPKATYLGPPRAGINEDAQNSVIASVFELLSPLAGRQQSFDLCIREHWRRCLIDLRRLRP